MEVGKRFNPYKGFTGSWLPNWLLDRNEISCKSKLVYARLCQFAGKDGKCHPSRKTLSKEIGISLSKVDRALRELKECKLIEADRRGLTKSNSYYFLLHEWQEGCKKLLSSQI